MLCLMPRDILDLDLQDCSGSAEVAVVAPIIRQSPAAEKVEMDQQTLVAHMLEVVMVEAEGASEIRVRLEVAIWWKPRAPQR